MQEQIQQLEERASQRLHEVASLADLEEVRRALLGKKGELTALLRGMGGVAAGERPRMGQLVNDAKLRIEAMLEARGAELTRIARDAALAAEIIDVTLPARAVPFGRRHPLTQTSDDIVRIFSGLGYEVVEGPEVETLYYNFDALNIGPDHPARDEKDSLFISDNLVMRTETSAVQIHVMESRQPPVKIIAPGRVYRRDAVDRTHSAIFHQVEGLLVDQGVTFGDLKGTLTAFLQQLFEAIPGGSSLRTRFRPHYFPFTEPSAEFDISCIFCGGTGCSTCKGTGWIELGGCGMVHPGVLENVRYDSETYTGFAFGFGIERMAMIKFGIDNIRLFYDNDIRFSQQF
ncbi:MAG: phenylalanine--tRNA ligase subunit alpha [Abitibacteriaceae bacterium]|nr:phenylalanine--tRNA ligase subunit alpha [Abditibacteriaceae bacterium]MBV9864440.1 phenylalanine--tRNA ligase subunit alpha [Abditibacteriaceae bacterium]